MWLLEWEGNFRSADFESSEMFSILLIVDTGVIEEGSNDIVFSIF